MLHPPKEPYQGWGMWDRDIKTLLDKIEALGRRNWHKLEREKDNLQ